MNPMWAAAGAFVGMLSGAEQRMLKIFALLQNFLVEPVRRDDRGVTAVEYAILITVVGLALITTLGLFSRALAGLFRTFITDL